MKNKIITFISLSHWFIDLSSTHDNTLVYCFHHNYEVITLKAAQSNESIPFQNTSRFGSTCPASHQTSSHYVRPNGLKLFVNFLNIVQTSWTDYKLHGWARTSRTLNLLKVFWQPSHSEPILGNVVGTSLVSQGLYILMHSVNSCIYVHVYLKKLPMLLFS